MLGLLKFYLNSKHRKEDYFTDESLQKYEEFSDLLNCPICLDMLEDPVECDQCSGTVCRRCLNANDIDNCNLCRQISVFRSSRNTVKFLDKFKFKCIFKNIGCNVESVYSNFDEHIKKCKSVDELLHIINEQQSLIDDLKSENKKLLLNKDLEHRKSKSILEDLKSEHKSKLLNTNLEIQKL